MSICSLVRGLERAFCARSSLNASQQQESYPLREGGLVHGRQLFHMPHETHQPDSGSSWKFWRRLSSRGRQEHKASTLRREKPEIVLLERSESFTGDGDTGREDSRHYTPLSSALPDVVENPPPAPRFTSGAVPPPKPPRLFLFRTPSTNSGRHPDANQDQTEEATYMNCERVAELKAQIQAFSSDSSKSDGHGDSSGNEAESKNAGENNNLVSKAPCTGEQRLHHDSLASEGHEEPPTAVVQRAATDPSIQTASSAQGADVEENTASIPSTAQQPTSRPEVSAQRPKIVTPELRAKRPGRVRRRSSEKGEVTRQRHIMNNVGELLRQRFDPYPMLGRLKDAGLLSDADIQTYAGTRDRRSVCEGLVDLMGDGEPELIPAFCDVLATSGASTEILEVLQVMREMDRIINEVQCSASESSVLEEEKNVTFDVGYLAPDLSLKPLVELERVRASGDKRLSKASSRASAYSLLEGDSDSCRNGEPGAYPGLVMMSVCVTGHDLSGRRAEALAQMVKSHNCISQLHLGKTQLSGVDISVVAKALQENSTVHSLDLRLNVVDQVGADSLSELLQNTKSLRNLNLSSTSLDLAAIKTITSAVAANRTLVDLDLSFLEISDESCSHLRDMLRSNSSLQKLRLRNNNITAPGCYALSEGLARNRSLCVLDLSRNTIGNEGMQALVKFLPESSCSELCVENCGLTSGACDSLAELITHAKKLRQLDLSTNLLLDSGICKLAPALERTSSLQNLGVNMCGITNDGFSKLLDVLEKNTSIVHMKLCYNRLGRDHTNPAATSDNLRYRLRIVTSSKPKLKILLWGNAFEMS